MNHIYRIEKLKGFLLVCFVLSCAAASAQQGNITGTVSTADGKAAEFVNVSLKGTNKGAAYRCWGEVRNP